MIFKHKFTYLQRILKRMKFVKLLTFCLVLLGSTLSVSTHLSAQDIHFSQFYMAPMDLNPALTGLMNCNVRISGNYRNQWASVIRNNAYNTYNIAYDQKLAVGRYDYFGFGATFWGDQAGSLNFGQFQGKLSFAYSKRMGGYRARSHYLVFGADAAFGQRRLDLSDIMTGSQHNGEGQGIPVGMGGDPQENFLDRNSFLFADVSAGLLWFSNFNKEENVYFGIAYHHLNRANVTFYDGTTESLYSKLTFHGGGEFMLNSRLGLVPGLLMRMQGPSMEVIPGTSFKFVLGSKRDPSFFQAGLWARIANKEPSGILGDALILQTRFDYQQFTFGFSYDLNISKLRPASNMNGAFEFAAQYKICGPERRNVYCPNF